MDERAKRLEKLKTAVIVVLFLTTILLLNLTWRSESSGGFRLSSVLDLIGPDVWVPQASELLQPDYAVYGFGDATYAVDRSRVQERYQEMLQLLMQQSDTSALLVSEVTPQQYRDMMTGFRSLRVVLSCGVPFSEFCEANGISRPSSTDPVGYVESFILSDAAPESIFVEGRGSCWRFLSDSEENIATPLLSSMERSEPTYYTAGSLFGNANLSLLPLSGSSNLAPAPVTRETGEERERSVREMAESIFGENFDFVRRITDSFGNITYMYGYGEKTLTCLTDGSFEYKTEPMEGPDPGFFGSLQAAVAYVATHGGWGTDRRDLAFCLCGAAEEGSGRSKLYTFEFAQKMGGVKLLSEDGPALIVKVSAGEVSYYRRAAVQSAALYGEMQVAAEAANVLAGNCHLISSVLGSNLLAATSDEEFSFVAEKFRDATPAYVVTEDGMEPAWVITMDGGTKLFFGLYDAVPLGFTRQ